MKLSWVKINNYRSCRNIELNISSLNALVGANNSGKTSILKALDFLFDPSVSKLDDECFWNKNTSNRIWIEAIFTNLSENEIESLQGYLNPDNTFHIARSGSCSTEDGFSKFVISQHYCKPAPVYPWLRQELINGDNTAQWWQNNQELSANGHSFVDFVGGRKPGVGAWKEFANDFSNTHLTPQDYEQVWADNPKGYSNVLKGTLPNFIYIPAVKDLSEETKTTKTNPFGQLLNKLNESITAAQRTEIDNSLAIIKNKLNKTDANQRLDQIVNIETNLNSILNNYMTADIEIEFEAPELELLLSSPKIHINDGIKNIAQNKGHGMQRALIFSILQYYSQIITSREDQRYKSTIFAVEEPEIYMHPQAQRNIRNVFLDITQDIDQIVFATHSSLLLDVSRFDEIIRLVTKRYTQNNNNLIETEKYQLKVIQVLNDLIHRFPNLNGRASEESIRELYSHAYHPTRSEGFFANKIILVEGATEQYSLPIYAKAMNVNLDLLNISIVDSGGKGSMDRLYRIFNELGIPCYMIIDYDKDNDDRSIIEKSMELLEMTGTATTVPDSILVNSKIACFPSNWETELRAEIPDYTEIQTECRQILGPSVGKPLIARLMAKKLTDRTEPFIPVSIRNIINQAISNTWTGSCLTE